MSDSIPFDTHEFVVDLTKAGMPTEQAEVLARRQASLINNQLATKKDLASLKKDLFIGVGTMLGIAIALTTIIDKIFSN